MSSVYKYRDFWSEFQEIHATTQKKFLKKPNLNEVLRQYNELAMAMEEGKMPEQAAHCHREIASIHAKLANHFLERRHLLKSAHLFYEALNARKQMHLTISCELVQFLEESYLMVAEQFMKEDCPRSAGLTFMEMAKQFEALGECSKSFSFLLKARNLLQNDIYMLIQVLDRMVDLISREQTMQLTNGNLNELLSAFASLPHKTQISDALRPQLVELECTIVLLQLLLSLPSQLSNNKNSQHSSSLALEEWRNAHAKTTVMTKEQYNVLSSFVGHVLERNYLEAAQICELELNRRFLDARGRMLCSKLLDSLK